MTTIPFATQDLGSPNENIGGVTRPPQGMVLHIAQGYYQGTIGYEHNPAAQVSSYCVVSKNGDITQVIDLDDKAWTESAGNDAWIGVEFEGFVPDALTPMQITAAARILAWLNEHYGVPIQPTDDPVNGHGLGYHSMGGLAWGGHFQCPGPNIVAQRGEILYQAQQLAQPKDIVVPQFNPPVVVDPVVADLGHPGGGAWTLGESGAIDAWGGAPGVRGVNGEAFFVGRKPARLEYPNETEADAGKILVVVDTQNERYALPV
jgi:N-acetylmuramoyl-L-alanine amidase